MERRHFLKLMVGACAWLPMKLWAAWNKPAFEAQKPDLALSGLGVSEVKPSDQIEIIAPNYAENGAVVQVEIKSHIANTEGIAVLVDKNPTSLIANYVLSPQLVPAVITRIKMAESATVQVIVKSGTHYYSASKYVEVSQGGCG